MKDLTKKTTCPQVCEVVTVPWSCGDRDCSTGWHLASFWHDGHDTYLEDRYHDGDAEPCDAGDVPSPLHEQESWLDYWAYCAATRLDPLRQIHLPVTRKTCRWEALGHEVRHLGSRAIRVVGARRNSRGPFRSLDTVPKNVRFFLTVSDAVDPRGYFLPPECNTFERLARSSVDCAVKSRESRVSPGKREILIRFLVDEVVEKPDHEVSRLIKRYATKEAAVCRERINHLKQFDLPKRRRVTS